MEAEERRVLLIIADISGYTRFMTANAKELAHAQLIITELMETILDGVEYPMEVSKLEGDAVFLYCIIDTEDWADPAIHSRLCNQLLDAYAAFADRVVHMTESSTCRCTTCVAVDTLRLKMVMHAGTALFHKVGDFNELAGVDVILVHRLLKNEVQANEYVLLTDPAFEELEFPEGIPWQRSTESYPEFGTVQTRVFVPQRERQRALEEFHARALTAKLGTSLGRFVKFALAAQPMIWGMGSRRNFQHVPLQASPTTRLVQAITLLVTTPLVLLIGIPVVAGRELLRHLSRSP